MKEMGSDPVVGEAVGLLVHSHWPSSIIGIWAVAHLQHMRSFDILFSSTEGWFGATDEDPTNSRSGEDWVRLTKDLLFNSEGLKFKTYLWNDIPCVNVPTLVDKVQISSHF